MATVVFPMSKAMSITAVLDSAFPPNYTPKIDHLPVCFSMPGPP
jgi:hypothetical protein